MAVWQLDDELWFPNPRWGEEDGLVAIGGDLSVERLVLAYSNGFFPWYAFHMEREPHWYCPLERYVIFPREIHISHSMRQLLKQQKYMVTVNEDFEGVINGCSRAQGRHEENGAWLAEAMLPASKFGSPQTMPWENVLSADSMVSHFDMLFSARACSRWFPMRQSWP